MKQPTTVRLLRDLVMLLPLPAETATPAGIVFPARYSNPCVSEQFRVIDTGPGRRLPDASVMPPDVSRGDYVLIESGSEHVIFENGVRIVPASQIIAKWSLPESVQA